MIFSSTPPDVLEVAARRLGKEETMTLDEFSERVLWPAMLKLADEIYGSDRCRAY